MAHFLIRPILDPKFPLIEKQAQEQETKLQEHISSLTTALEEAKEQQVDLQPFKEHVLAQKAKMLKLQTAIEEERCKVLQIDG